MLSVEIATAEEYVVVGVQVLVVSTQYLVVLQPVPPSLSWQVRVTVTDDGVQLLNV